MLKGLITTMTLVSVLAGVTFVDAAPKFSASVDAVRGFGDTKYNIFVCDQSGGSYCLESELEFPTNPFLLRLNLDTEGAFPGGTPWRLHADVARNINDPGGAMKDSDWISNASSDLRIHYSYTESDAQLGAWLLDFNGRIIFYRHHSFTLQGIFGYKYHKLTYEVFGVDGWGLDPYSGARIYFTEYEGVNVLDYEITYHIPYVGAGTSVNFGPAWEAYLEMSYSPKTSAKDFDDHLLRFKTAESDCDGKSLIGAMEVTYKPNRSSGGFNWFVTFGGEFLYSTTEGLQVQTWYGDDPASEEDDTGSRYPNIATEIDRWSQTLYLTFGTNL